MGQKSLYGSAKMRYNKRDSGGAHCRPAASIAYKGECIMSRLTVGVFNDSFPPTIDGVANAALNYANSIEKNLGHAVVATPWYPDCQDDYPFKVVRYPSAYISKRLGYRAGYPFDLRVLRYLQRQHIDIIHVHAPFISAVLARVLRRATGAPIVFTYHTKFNIDIEKRVAFNPVRNASVRFLLSNINACDEVWVVSEGAGENLRSLGYTGEYRVMENGTDFQKGRAPEGLVAALREKHGLPPELPVFLFVGRMMWYKGVRISIDGLKAAKDAGKDFRMVFIGEGVDRPEIMDYAAKLGLAERCVFTGAVRDRELLRGYFSLADLFLFPSTYDTNGIVVREAAACSCGSVLIRGSCAAEGIDDGETGILIEENGGSMGKAIIEACGDRERLRRIGENAAERIYLSWDDAVARAYARYEEILAAPARKSDRAAFNQAFFAEVQQIKEDYQLHKSQFKEQLLHYYTRQARKISRRNRRFKGRLYKLMKAMPADPLHRKPGRADSKHKNP
jgi:1,2-diacylglycerol 3-alpha-glucosyltransferase